MRSIQRLRLLPVAAAAVLMAACSTPIGTTEPDGPVDHPVLLKNTPYPDNVTIILPAGEPQSRARTLARAGCGPDRPQLVAVQGDRYVFNCLEILIGFNL